MNEIENYKEKIFEDIKHIDEEGEEFWLARELMPVLEYSKWENFHKVIKQTILSCENSDININYHFPEVRKPIVGGKGNIQNVIDFKLSRYACYMIVQNADSRKKVVALGQTYFAVQTRRQELSDEEYNNLSDDQKRLYQRELTKKGNLLLNKAAKNAGVKNYDKFHNYGYKGLYNGETANDIHNRKKLRYREDILDNMGEDELIINQFRIVQTRQKLINENIQGEGNADMTHFEVGKEIRNTIKRLGGTMPEDLPTPNKSLKVIEKEQRKEITKKV